ncbi:MAG: hypothetical protein ACTHVO_13265 [Brevibacterium yomogidense]
MARHPWKKLWREQCAGRMPAYRILVPDSVTDLVLRAWEARGYALPASRQTNPARVLGTPGETRNLIRSNVLFRALTGAGAATTGVVGLGTFGVSWLAGDPFAGGIAATGLLAAGTGATGAVTGTKYLRDPKRLSRKDREVARSARWITPTALGFVPGVKNAQDTDEQRLFHLAVTLATRIAATRAWTHPILADHVARVDLDEMVASVGVRLVELVTVRTELDAMSSGTEAVRVKAYLSRLAEAFESIADRVLSMHEYLEHLRALDAQLIALDHSERTREVGERVLDIVSRTAGDESIGAQFRDLNMEAESHAESIAKLLEELDETADDFDDLDSQIAKAAQTGGARVNGDRGEDQPAALPAEADPATRIDAFLDGEREKTRVDVRRQHSDDA